MENEKLLEEFKKCSQDPAHFISRYIKVTHPVRGLVPFKLYPFQERILEEPTRKQRLIFFVSSDRLDVLLSLLLTACG